MAQLAIKWHETRGKEVIEILEMLGAKNCDLKGYGYNLVYYIRTDGYIGTSYTDLGKDYKVFTLEEFLKKFPYKVGDSVSSKYLKNYKIEKAEWVSHGNRVIYKLQGMGWYSADELQPYKEEIVEEKTVNSVYPISKCKIIGQGTYAIKIVDGYNFDSIDENGNIIVKSIKPQYPKTYIECAKILKCFGSAHIDGYKCELLEKLQEFLICRDAYWKIAGDWIPSDRGGDIKYVIQTVDGRVACLDTWCNTRNILVFPTAEMRDAFYENFKDLIEECKEFL